jgi:hypothetical protein
MMTRGFAKCDALCAGVVGLRAVIVFARPRYSSSTRDKLGCKSGPSRALVRGLLCSDTARRDYLFGLALDALLHCCESYCENGMIEMDNAAKRARIVVLENLTATEVSS